MKGPRPLGPLTRALVVTATLLALAAAHVALAPPAAAPGTVPLLPGDDCTLHHADPYTAPGRDPVTCPTDDGPNAPWPPPSPLSDPHGTMNPHE